MSSCVIFVKAIYNADKTKEINFELVIDAFATLKMKQIFALENLDRIDMESQFNAIVENLELSATSQSFNRIASITFDIYEDKGKIASSYVEPP